MTQRDRRSMCPRSRPAADRCVPVANGHQRTVLYSSAMALVLSLIVLGPQAGGVPASHGSAVFLPPYKSVGTQHVPVHVAIGCARSVGSRLSWDASVGRISGTGTAWSKVCIKSQYGGVSSNSAQWSSALGLTIPLKVPSNGNHSIALQWTINLGARSPSTTGR